MTQRYTSPTAISRMRSNTCPECGASEFRHGGWGGPGCSLTDYGVAERVFAQRQDDGATVTEVLAQAAAATQDVLNDNPDANEDDVFHDVLVSALHGVDPWIATEVWRTQIGGPLPLELQQTRTPKETR
jgi:hypothetical protein